MIVRRDSVLCILVGSALTFAGCQAPGPAQGPTNQGVRTAGQPLPRVLIETSAGDITIALDIDRAPATSLNFVHYVESGYYEDTIFHRVLQESVIQGGGYTTGMELKPLDTPPTVTDDWQNSLENDAGTIALIRGKGPNGGGSGEFFINVRDNVEMHNAKTRGRFAVFGKVVDGQDAIERIRATPVATHPTYAAGRSRVVPVLPITIRSVRLLAPFDRSYARQRAADLQAPEKERIARMIRQLEKDAGREAATSTSGLVCVDQVIGKGPKALPTDTILFNYRGTLLDGTEFESTFEKEPAVRELKKLIPGLQEALTTMNEGGRRIAILPPDIGWGRDGIPGLVPPDSTIIFEIEFLAIH